MPLINLILAVIILAGVIILVVRQIKIRKLDKKIEENWKEINEDWKGIIKPAEEAEEMLGITGIKLEDWRKDYP